jgi:SSS family solute:Na+ symporter
MFSDLRRYRFMTMAEELACYYGGNRVVYHVSAMLLFLASVGWLGLHLMGGGFYLSFITGIPAKLAIVVGGVGFGVYVIMGGYFAVVYTDLIQVIILFLGFVFLSIFTLIEVGGFAGLAAKVPAEFMSFLGYKAVGWRFAVATAMASGVGVMVTPSFRHRIYSGRDVPTVRKSYIYTGLATLVFCLLPSIVGMGAYALDSGIARSDHALPWLAVSVFPIGIAALVIISGLSATLSSADSDSACGVVFYIRHLYHLLMGRFPADPIKTSRIALGVMFIIAVLSVIWFDTLIDYINRMTSFLFSGLLAMVILGKYWRGATPGGAMGAVIAGSLTTIIVPAIPALNEFFVEPILPATVMSFIACWVVSLFTGGKEKLPFDRVAEMMADERRELETIQASGDSSRRDSLQ